MADAPNPNQSKTPPAAAPKQNPSADQSAGDPTTSLGPIDAGAEDEFKPRASGAAPLKPSSAKPMQGEDRLTKRIVTTVTVHKAHPGHVPYKFDVMGGIIEGSYQAGEYPPGAVVELEAREADKILSLFGGRELKPDEHPVDAPGPVINARI